MLQPNIICLAIDRLHIGYLGAYGSTWVSTPALDRLASESLVLDRMMIDSPQLQSLYRSLWLGCHAMVPEARIAGTEPMPARLANAGWKTTLFTDDPTLAAHPLADAFDQRFIAERYDRLQNDVRSVAEDLSDTDAAAFFAQAIDWLEKSPRTPFLLWAHTGTLGKIWDAPLNFRAQYHDEDDPAAEDWSSVPNRVFSEKADPDELLGLRHAYAGQVSLIDELVGSLIEVIDRSPAAPNTMLVVVSTRGFPLGEHGRIGLCDEALYAELTHVPCFVRLPQGAGASLRSQSLVQPADLCATLLDIACGSSSRQSPIASANGRSILPLACGDSAGILDRAFAISPDHGCRVETPAWAMRLSPATKRSFQPQVELFVKPDDWCEVNEVSGLCPEIVDQLQSVLAEFRQGCETGEAAAWLPLGQQLIFGFE
ncbi:MAG: sulfatase-like hydrolase/transferase [Pirellulales bacterium]|nr:sulfatase-like hydrolase/transferase [Pirellulales bacterium]